MMNGGRGRRQRQSTKGEEVRERELNELVIRRSGDRWMD